MAIKIGKKAEESSFTLFQGIGAFHILSVNPNKSALSKLTGREVEEEPKYSGTTEDGHPYVRIVFWGKSDPSSKVNNGIETLVPFSFMLQDTLRVGSNSGKTQIIDKYGRTAWATPEELNNKEIPVYSNGKEANISADYRPAYVGEEELIKFIIAWLNIPNPMDYNRDTKTWSDKADMNESEVSLDMKALLKGNVKEISSIIPAVAPYAVKTCLGVRTTDEGRQYQSFYNRMFLRNSESNYGRIDADIKDAQSRGSFPNVEFSTAPLHEYSVESTQLESKLEPATDNPWDAWGK